MIQNQGEEVILPGGLSEESQGLQEEKPEVYTVKKVTPAQAGSRREFIANSLLAGTAIPVALGIISGCEEDVSPRAEYKSIRYMMHSGPVLSVAISPGGKTLASSSRDETIKLWSIPDGQLLETLKGHNPDVNSVQFSPDGKTLASGSSDSTIKLWSVPDGQLVKTINVPSGNVSSVCFDRDGKILASGSGDVIYLRNDLSDAINFWSVPDGELIRSIDWHTDVYSIDYSPDGTMLASANFDGTIKLWSVTDGQQLKSLTTNSLKALSVCFSPDGKILASGGEDSSIRLWSIPDGKIILSDTCTCDTVCTCNTVTINNNSDICICNTVESCTCNAVCSCNTICSCDSHSSGGSYWYPN